MESRFGKGWNAFAAKIATPCAARNAASTNRRGVWRGRKAGPGASDPVEMRRLQIGAAFCAVEKLDLEPPTPCTARNAASTNRRGVSRGRKAGPGASDPVRRTKCGSINRRGVLVERRPPCAVRRALRARR